MADALVRQDPRVANIRTLLEKSKAQIAMALPAHVKPERMLRVAMTSVQHTPKLLECTPVSLMAAIIQCSQLGLEPDGVLGHAYLVPYKTTVQLIPGYKGLIDLARRSGQLSTIMAQVVREKDKFDFEFGDAPFCKHKPSRDADPGKVTDVYAVAVLRDGGKQFDVMSVQQIEAIRARSRASGDGPWVTDWEEMAKKTVLRRLCKLLPCSVELQRVVALDEMHEAGKDQQLAIDTGLLSFDEEPKPKTLDRIADKLGAQPAKKQIDVPSESVDQSEPDPDPLADEYEVYHTECAELFAGYSSVDAIKELLDAELAKATDDKKKLIVTLEAKKRIDAITPKTAPKGSKQKQETMYQ